MLTSSSDVGYCHSRTLEGMKESVKGYPFDSIVIRCIIYIFFPFSLSILQKGARVNLELMAQRDKRYIQFFIV